MNIQKRNYGWRKDELDSRDYTPEHPKVQETFKKLRAITLPEEVDLRPLCSPVEDQGQLGSCTANAAVGYIELIENRDHKKYKDHSRLYVYYNTRQKIEGVNGDVGATIRDTVKSTVQYGACLESTWPYAPEKYDIAPSKECYDEGSNYQTLTYANINKLADIQANLAANNPVIIGILVFSSFENVGENGIIPMPAKNEGFQGGHAILVVGYKKINGSLYLICKNSWGPNWGDKGYFYLPARYLDQEYEGYAYSSDWWVIFTEEFIDDPTPSPTPDPLVDVDSAVANINAAEDIMKKTNSRYWKQAKPKLEEAKTNLGR